MDTYLSEILIEVCKENGCEESYALPSLKILNENFFFRLRDLKNVNFDLWKSMNLPMNLFFILQGKLALFEGEVNINPFIQQNTSNNLQNQNQNSRIDINTNINKQYPIPINCNQNLQPYQNNISNTSNVQPLSQYEPPRSISFESNRSDILSNQSNLLNLNPMPILNEDDILRNDVYQNLDSLVSEINDKEKAGEVLRKIHTIIMKIIENPNEPKFKKLKLDSNFYNTYIKPYKGAIKFLQILHFATTTDNQFLEYCFDNKFINKVGDLMNEFLIERKFAQLNFNPYQSSFTSIGGNPDASKLKTEKTDFDELISQELQRRNDIVKKSQSVDRKPKIFTIKSSESIGEIVQSLNEEEKDDSKKVEEDDFYKYAMNVIKGNTDKFVVKRRTEFEKLVKKPIYSKATLRIKFPNEFLIQGNFAMMETLGDVYNFVKENLLDQNAKFILFTSFPAKKYTDLKSTIYSQGLAPSTLLYISFPDIDPQKNLDYPYLNPDAIEKFITVFKLNK